MTHPPQPGFSTVMRGYDVAQVNQLLNRIAAAQADPALAPTVAAEIASAKFDVVLRGFDLKQVDEFLAHTSRTLAGGGQPAADPQLPALLTHPRGERFAKRRLRGGYRVDEVDAYVERVHATLNSTLTSHEVEAVQFRNGFGAYDVDAVDDWLHQVQTYLRSRGR